jgi:Ca2+-binding RTX toxin-like protein
MTYTVVTPTVTEGGILQVRYNESKEKEKSRYFRWSGTPSPPSLQGTGDHPISPDADLEYIGVTSEGKSYLYEWRVVSDGITEGTETGGVGPETSGIFTGPQFTIVDAPTAGGDNPPPPPPVVEFLETGSSIPDGPVEFVDLGNDGGDGTNPPGRSFLLRNNGGSGLVLGDIIAPPGFSVVLSRKDIPPGGGALVEVVFVGTDPGTYEGNVVIYNNSGEPYNFPVRATASAPTASNLTPVNGTAENDVIFGGDGDQNILGAGGDDQLFGNRGNDLLTGGDGNDALYGGKDEDTLLGGTGNDVLSGDLGNDLLTGGADADIFVLGAGDGTDTVTDFATGVDLIGLKPDLTFEQLSISVSGGNTVIAFGDEVLGILNGVTAPLSASDFTVPA